MFVIVTPLVLRQLVLGFPKRCLLLGVLISWNLHQRPGIGLCLWTFLKDCLQGHGPNPKWERPLQWAVPDYGACTSLLLSMKLAGPLISQNIDLPSTSCISFGTLTDSRSQFWLFTGAFNAPNQMMNFLSVFGGKLVPRSQGRVHGEKDGASSWAPSSCHLNSLFVSKVVISFWRSLGFISPVVPWCIFAL